MTDKTWFPLLGTGLAIKRSLLNEQQAQKNHGQSLDRLEERGGLSPSEALAVINRRGWQNRKTVEALGELIEATKKLESGT